MTNNNNSECQLPPPLHFLPYLLLCVLVYLMECSSLFFNKSFNSFQSSYQVSMFLPASACPTEANGTQIYACHCCIPATATARLGKWGGTDALRRDLEEGFSPCCSSDHATVVLGSGSVNWAICQLGARSYLFFSEPSSKLSWNGSHPPLVVYDPSPYLEVAS